MAGNRLGEHKLRSKKLMKSTSATGNWGDRVKVAKRERSRQYTRRKGVNEAIVLARSQPIGEEEPYRIPNRRRWKP